MSKAPRRSNREGYKSSSPHREQLQELYPDDAELERAMKEMEAKHKADLAKMQTEYDEFTRRCLEDTEKENQQSTEESEQQLSEMKNQHEQEMSDKELIKTKESEEFEARKRKGNLAAQEFEAKERTQKELLLQKRCEAEEEDKILQTELEEKLEEQFMLNMMDYDEKKIQTYMEIEENMKKAEEEVKSYIKATQEKTQEEVEKIKEELRYQLYK